MSDAAIELEGIQIRISGHTILDIPALMVPEQSRFAILGPNGAGKTTCMDLISGRQKVTSGQVFFKGHDITRAHEHTIVRRGIGRKFQIPAVFQELSVLQNFEVARGRGKDPFGNMWSFGRPKSDARFEEIVELTGLKNRLNFTAGLLSHGETQWLEIGMVLMQEPDLLLMDEPTAGLDPNQRARLYRVIQENPDVHWLISTHQTEDLEMRASSISVMDAGEMVWQGATADFLALGHGASDEQRALSSYRSLIGEEE